MPCQLVPLPDSPDFEAPTGATVTLATTGDVGSVRISKAEYAGEQLIDSGTTVSSFELTIRRGRNTLELVFVFSAGLAGQGELREDSDGTIQVLRMVAGDEPLQLMTIIGT